MSEEAEKDNAMQQADERALKEKSRSGRQRKSSEPNTERKRRSSKHRSSSRDSHGGDLLGGSEGKSSSKPERRRSKDADDTLGGTGKRSSGRPSRRKSRDSHDKELDESRRSKDSDDKLGGSTRRSGRPDRRKSKDSDDDDGNRRSSRPARRKSRDSDDGPLGSSKHRSRSRDQNDALVNSNDSVFTEEQRVKSQSRRKVSGPAVPGAFVETAQEDRATRRKGDSAAKSTSGKDREARDREAKNRARRQSGGATSTSARESRDRRAKDQARRQPGSAAARPGASSEVVGNRRAKADPRLSNVRQVASNAPNEEEKREEEGNIEINAIAVDAEENEQLQEQQQEIENLKKTLNQIAQQQNETPKEPPAPQPDDKASGKKKCMYLVIALVLLGGGIAGYFFGTQKTENVVDPAVEAPPTDTPSESPTDKAIQQPNPTSTPTVFKIFEAPSEEDCAAIASGNELEDQELFETNSFAVNFEVTLQTEQDDERSYLPVLENALQAIFIPEVAGCLLTRRRLQLREQYRSRELQLKDYVIANGLVLESFIPSETTVCQENQSPLCTRVTVTLDLWFRQKVQGFLVLGHLSEVLSDDPVERMNLRFLFSNIAIVNGEMLSPSDPPSIAPSSHPTILSDTASPTVMETANPTVAESANPTFAPVVGPTTEQPTRLPTEAPTKSPTRIPTASPSAQPTLVPVVGPTPPPTIAATNDPTPEPTPFPTIAPTDSPTSSPTDIPSESPSRSPTPKPSEMPTGRPTASPSKSPTQSPSFTVFEPPPENYLITSLAAASQSGSFAAASLAIDGNTDGNIFNGSVSHTRRLKSQPDERNLLLLDENGPENRIVPTNREMEETTPWWEVDLGFSASVTRVRVYNRADCCRDWIFGSKLQLIDSTGAVVDEQTITIGENNSFDPIMQEFEFSGDPLNVQKIRIVHGGHPVGALALAEVEPYGYANLISQLAVASQSSTFADANLAIDGNTCGDYFSCSTISHTWASNPANGEEVIWWEVDLGESANVQRVRVWNRIDAGLAIWLYGSTLTLLDSGGTVKAGGLITIGENGDSATPDQSFWFDGITDIRTIRIEWGGSRNGSGAGEICLAEVEVTGGV